MRRLCLTLCVAGAVGAMLAPGEARQGPDPVVVPPAPVTNITVSMAEFMTAGASNEQAFHQAVDAARQRQAARLVIPPGTYRFTQVNNSFHLIVGGLHDVTIDGQGAEFVFTQPAGGGIGVFGSQRLVIRNLVVDYDVRTASPGFAQKEPDGTTSIRIDDAYPITAATPVEAVTTFDAAAKAWRKTLPEVYFPSGVQLIRPQTIRSPSFNSFAAGVEVLVRHYVYAGQAFHSGDSSDIAFEDLTIYSSPGMAFTVAATGRGYRFSRNRVLRRDVPGRLISVASDGIHIASTYGDIIVEDNDFSGQGDDSLNLHGNWLDITAVAGSTVRLQKAGYGLVGVGDQLSFVRRADLSEVARATIAAVDTVSGPVYNVTLTAAVPAAVAVGQMAGNLSRSNPRFRVRRNVFHDHRARGILIQAPDGIIEDNVIRDVTMQGMHLTADANYFFETLGLDGVTVRRNLIQGVGYGSGDIYQNGRHMGAISLVADVASGLSAYPRHRNVVIEDNTIVDTPALGILIASADGVVVRNNTIIGANAIPFSTLRSGTAIDAAAAGALMVTRASNVTVLGNREVTATGVPAQGVYVDQRNTPGAVVSGQAHAFSPIISSIGNVATAPGIPVSAPFTVDDSDTPYSQLMFSASSSNLAVVPVANISVSGAGPDRSVTVHPAIGQIGNATVTVTVSDGQWTAGAAFTVTVVAGSILTTATNGTSVSLAWTPAAVAGLTGYAIEAGVTPGTTAAMIPVGLVTGLTVDAPSGVFFVRIRALTTSGPGPASNEVVVAAGTAAAPGAPSNLLAAVDGSMLYLAWRNAEVGGAVASVRLEASTAGAVPLGSLPLAAGTESFVTPAPPGRYMIRIRAIGPTLVSGPSNGVVVTVPGACAVPAAPQRLTASASGGAVLVSWGLGPVGSAAPSSYVLEARTTGGALIGTIPLAGHELRANAPSGTYVLRLRALSPCGPSAPTPDVTLVVP